MKTEQEMLDMMARIAQKNKEAVAKALGKKPQHTFSQYVKYAEPTKK